MDLKPTVVSNPHPLIGDGREFAYEGFKPGEMLGDYVARVGIKLPKGSMVVLINGVVALHDWRRYVLQEGDDIVFRSSARGGGGGGKVLRIVAMVAIAIVSAGYGTALGEVLGFTGNMATAVGGTLLMVGGSLVLNAVLPPPKPKAMGIGDKEQSPTYGISAGRNQSSPYNPMQLVFGLHKIVPYLASKPYTTFVGNDQYLSQAFHFGLQPDLTLTDLKLGDTHLSNYLDVEVNRSEYDGKLSLVAGNVDTLEGFELNQADGWIQRTTPVGTEFISADVAATLHDIKDDGEERKATADIEAQYRVIGATNWTPMGGTGGRIATHYWSLGYWTTEKRIREQGDTEVVTFGQTWHQVRFGSIDLNERQEGETQEKICHDELDVFGRIRQICKFYRWRWISHPAASKRPWQGSAPDPFISYVNSGLNRLEGSDPQKPTRITINQKVPKGQYDVRFRKVTGDVKTSQKSNATTITQIRCTQTDDADYTGQARLAVRIKATSQLNGAIDTLSAVASAKCPVWNGSAWEEKETSNPAWWYLWWARGKRDVNFRRLYGECLTDTRIDIEAIKSWALFCEQKKLSFNWVLDRKMSIEEVYYTIARAGRASTTWQIGKRGVLWDSDKLPAVTLVTPANIMAGSYSYKVINAEVADEVVINFHNEKLNWEKDVVRQKVPGSISTNNPVTLDLEGVTNQNQAGREANLLAASQYYHRKQHTWEMDVEGAVLARGDVCQLTHDLTSFASSGRVLEVLGNVLTLDHELPATSNGWLCLRAPNNQLAYLRVASLGFKATVLSWPSGFNRPTDDKAIDYIWQFDPVKTPGTKLQIKSVVPQSNGNIRFEAVEYLSAYYQSENNPFVFVPTKVSNAIAPIAVYSVSASEHVLDEASGRVELSFAWVMSEQANADVSLYVNGEFLISTRVAGYQTSLNVRENDIVDIEILPFKPKRAATKYRHQHVVAGTQIVVPVPTGLEIIGGFNKTSVRIKWDRVLNAVGYEVQVESNSGNIVRRTVKVGSTLTYTYSHADMLQDGGLTRTLTFKIRALGMRESKSAWVSITGTNPQIGQLQGVEVFGGVKKIVFNCTKPTDEDFVGYLFWISDSSTFKPTVANAHFDGNFNQYYFETINKTPLAQKDYYIWAAGYDTFGKDSLNISPSYKVRPLVSQLDPQSIAADMIKDGALTLNKFAESIKPPLVVTAMPTTAKENDQVILTSTGKLYRYIGGVWKLQVNSVDDIDKLPSSKIDGSLALSQLPTIPTTKLSGQIQTGQIAANAVGANHIGANVIHGGHIAANTINANHLQANSIQAVHMSADSVVAGKVAAGAIGADQIQANSITTEKLVVRGNNLIPNSNFATGDFTDWRPYAGSAQVYLVDGLFGESDIRAKESPSKYVCSLANDAGNTARGSSIFAFAKAYTDVGADKAEITVKTLETYYLSLDVCKGGSGTDHSYLRLICYFFDRNGRMITSKDAIGTVLYTNLSWSWQTLEGRVVVPADAVRMSVYVFYNSNAAEANASSIAFTNLRCLRMMDSSLVVDGAIKTQHIVTGTLHGNVLSANTVDGDKIIANSLHANRIIAGTITAASGILADASVTNAKIANLAVTDAKIANLAVTNAKIGNLSVNTIKIADHSVTTLDVHNINVTKWVGYLSNKTMFTITIPAGEYFISSFVRSYNVGADIPISGDKMGHFVDLTIAGIAVSNNASIGVKLTGEGVITFTAREAAGATKDPMMTLDAVVSILRRLK